MCIEVAILEAEEGMDSSLDYFQRKLNTVRTGRASTAMLDYITVEYHGSTARLQHLAGVSVVDAATLAVKPFDPGAKGEIVKAIDSAGIGLRAFADGAAVRVSVPLLSSDRRKELTSQAKQMAEEAKISVRGKRREANKVIGAALADKQAGVTEHQAKSAYEQTTDLTQKAIDKIDELLAKKIAEIEE